MLLLHESMIVRLSDVLAPKHALVKDKVGIVIKIDLHHQDKQRLDNLPCGYRQFFPEYMAKGVWVKILKYKQSLMKKHLLQHWHSMHGESDIAETDAGSVLFVALVYAEFKIDVSLSGDLEQIVTFPGSVS